MRFVVKTDGVDGERTVIYERIILKIMSKNKVY